MSSGFLNNRTIIYIGVFVALLCSADAASACGGRSCIHPLGITGHSWTPGTDDYSFMNDCEVRVTAIFSGGDNLNDVLELEPGEWKYVNCNRPCFVHIVREICDRTVLRNGYSNFH